MELAELRLRGTPDHRSRALGTWCRDSAIRHLALYLETFAHTVGVMQTEEQLIRVARECALDLADDGVVYAELRFAPELHIEGGLELERVVEAVHAGFREGEQEAAADGHADPGADAAHRDADAARSLEIAELAVGWRDRGVGGFDIAGAEAGYPPTRHLDAFEHLRRENAHLTIHAGEGVRAPLDLGGDPGLWRGPPGPRRADRRRHRGTRRGRRPRLGRLAANVRDTRIPLELCPTSNIQTGAAPSVAEHPIGMLDDLRFRVTVNTDNR